MRAPRRSPTPSRSILVYSVEELSGDGLIKLPFVAGLRAAFPDAHITWCAASGKSVYSGWLKPVVFRFIDQLLLGEPLGERLRVLSLSPPVRRPDLRPDHRHPRPMSAAVW